jgi:hypothetical protein
MWLRAIDVDRSSANYNGSPFISTQYGLIIFVGQIPRSSPSPIPTPQPFRWYAKLLRAQHEHRLTPKSALCFLLSLSEVLWAISQASSMGVLGFAQGQSALSVVVLGAFTFSPNRSIFMGYV